MADLGRVPLVGLRAVSLFAGCGGFDLGLRQAGIDVPWANELDRWAQESYRANHHGILDPRDIHAVTAADILDQVGPIDLVVGGPPCQPFSTAGPRSGRWDGVIERLSFEFLRVVAGTRPRAFVMENVPGMRRGVSVGVFNEALREMKAIGYRVKWREVGAHWLGVPQDRMRLIFVGAREDLGVEPRFPSEGAWHYGVQDAIPEAAAIEGWDCYRRLVLRPAHLPMPTVLASDSQQMKWRDAEGRTHAISIDQLKLLCGFPRDFALVGPEAEQRRRLGNCVPPPMAKAIGLALIEMFR
jgi:DNA (cytosine-5)-methyltransferase 1